MLKQKKMISLFYAQWELSLLLRCLFVFIFSNFLILLFVEKCKAVLANEILPITNLEEDLDSYEIASQRKDKYHFYITPNIYRFKDKFRFSKLKGTQKSNALGFYYTLDQDWKIGAYYLYGRIKSHSPIYITKSETSLHGVFPYVLYYFSPNFFFNMVGGYEYILTHLNRTYVPNMNNVTAKSKSNLWLAAPSLNFTFSKFNTSNYIQLGYAQDTIKSRKFVESNGNIIPAKTFRRKQLYFFSDFSYNFRNLNTYVESLAPYIQLGTDYTLHLTPVKSAIGEKHRRAREGYTVGAGLRVFSIHKMSFSVGWQRIAGHSGLCTNLYNALFQVSF